MIRPSSLVAAGLVLGGCAATAPAPETSPPAASAETAESAPPANDVYVAPIPAAPQVALRAPAEDIVCTYEKRTGSHRVERVCRRQSAIDQEATAAKRTFDELHRSQREYQK